jgi:hypothetical protein
MSGAANNKNKIEIPVKKDMRDYSNDPYFVKKAEKAAAFLKKHGLPKQLKQKQGRDLMIKK